MMNRAKSIKDIGEIYRTMQQTNKSVISESKKVKTKMPKDSFKAAGECVKEPSSFKKSGPKSVKGLAKPKKNKKFSQKNKKTVKENINNFMNIFDKLYEDVMKNDDLDIDTGIGMGPEGSAGEDDFEMGADDSSGEDEVSITIDKNMAKELIGILQAAVGDEEDMGEEDMDSDLEDLGVGESDDSDEDEDEEYEDEDENELEDEDEDENFYETIEMSKLPDSAGHKLQKGMEAGGTIKRSNAKADGKVTDKVGNEFCGHPMDHKSELTNPSKNKVGNLKSGKSLFDQ